MSQAERKARRAARVVLKLYEERAPYVAHAIDKLKVTCKEGCAHCCMLPASATMPEMIPVVEHMVRMPDWPKRKPELERQINLHLAESADVDMLDQVERTRFFTKQMPCVFLKDARCEIYNVRPAVCRYHMVTSPPENCALGATNPTTKRVDLRQLEQEVALEGARETGELLGGTIAQAFVLAADRLGIELKIDRALFERGQMTRAKL